MATLTVHFDGEEVSRQTLSGPLVIGRSTECDVTVRDVRLSRRHCRIEPLGKDWVIADLGSKNGVTFGGKPISMRVLQDQDELAMGRTRLRFYAGAVVPPPAAPRPEIKRPDGTRRRPADPLEALSNTISDFETEFAFPQRAPARQVERFPTPLPRPRDPDAYTRDGVYSMVTDLISSSWDSIYASNARPAAVMVSGQSNKSAAPTSAGPAPRRARKEHLPPAALELQANPVIDSAPPMPPPPTARGWRQKATSWLGRLGHLRLSRRHSH